MSKPKTLKLCFDFIQNDPRMELWMVDGKLLLRKNPLAIFVLKGNGVNKNQYEVMTGIRVRADTPCAVSHLDQANLILYWIVNICMQRPRKGSTPVPRPTRLVVGACMRLSDAATTIRPKVCHLMAVMNELEERLKALNFLPQTYVTYLRGLHAKQGPYMKIAPGLDNFITWCIQCDPAVGQSQRAHTISDEDYEYRVSSSLCPPELIV
jgi:hypothetical protein